MKSLFYVVFLIAISQSITHHRLSTNQPNDKILQVDESIISTLGLFKAVLKKTKCTLTVMAFNNVTNKYDYKGDYLSSVFTGDCNSLQIKDGRLETDTGSPYLTVTNVDYNHSTIFSIDDQGVMRLIGTYIQENRVDIVSNETVIDQFKTNNKYVKSFSQLVVAFFDRFDAFQNQRRWKFIAEYGQLTIYYGENPAIKVDYVYSALTIRDSRIYDFDNQTFPGTLFTNITFEPRCSDPQIYLDFKPPYVFVADPYWPIVTVYEQGGYKIITVGLSKLSQYDASQNFTEINYHKFYSPCPPKTFEYRGNCLASCPAPYYHQMKGQSGFCVLSCQEFAAVNETTRICNCVTDYEFFKLSSAKLVKPCPSNAVETPYGCQCNQNGSFYDGLLTFSCVKSCPNTTVGINNLCMTCPKNCRICQRDGFNRQFLECMNCTAGYTLFQGQCILTCVTNYGKSVINNQCTSCRDANCVDCSNDSNFCLKCDLMFSLQNGTCQQSCSSGLRNVYSDYFSSSCLPANDQFCMAYLTSHYKGVPYTKCDQCFPGYYSHLNTCVQQCPPGYYVFRNYCTCGGVANLTIHDKCLNQVACPIGMSFDIRSHSCLSCPFGCMSCINTQCTSCNPGYFLYVSPQNILCRRKSPLFPCDNQYSWQRNTTCMLTNYSDPTLGMTLCNQSVPNCQVCIPRDTQICIVCSPGFRIYNNTCIQTCPTPLIAFDNTCILPEIVNCSVPHLLSIRKYANITLTSMKTSESYKFYVYDNAEQANDPVGYMPYFQEITTHKSDGIPRETSFFALTWTCLKCNDGYGLTDDFKQCLPCPSQCPDKKCYMARNDSCLTNTNTSCGIYEYIDKQTGACLQSCNESNKYPEIQQGRLYCVAAVQSATRDYMRVDSAVYLWKDGTQQVYFVFSDQLKNAPNVEVRSFNSKDITTQKKLSDVLDANSAAFHPSASAAVVGQGLPLSQSSVSSPIYSLPVQRGTYVELNQQPFNAYLLNLSQSLLNLTGANQPNIFPSKIYGTVYQADHTVFMTTWLAYIGYIMSIVVILLHAVFIGNELLYKVDNLLIFTQTIYFFSYVKNLVGRLLAQFYFGWSFAHARFLPNLFQPIIPDHYVERQAPVSYKLMNIDGNYFRNAGFSLAWLLIFIAGWAIVAFILWSLVFRLCRKYETWHPRIARQSLAAAFQFFSMNLVFFSVSQLAYSNGAYQGGFQEYFDRSQALAIITLSVVFVYIILRLMFNPLGGLYMLKRTLIAVILVFGYNIPLMILPLIFLQILFALFRHILQRPITKMQKLSIWLQSLFFIGCYLLLFLCLDAGVNTIILSIFIFIFIVYLAYDLTTIYLESRNQFPEEKLVKEYEEMATEMHRERANTVNFNNNPTRFANSRGGSILMIDRDM